MTADAQHWTARRVVLALVGSALVAFVLVGSAAVVIANAIAKEAALSEAARSARGLARVVFAPELPAVINGDPAARARLDAEVDAREADGGLLRVKVWNRDGLVLYSDADAAIGRRFPVGDDILQVIDAQISSTDLSDLSGDENITEQNIAPGRQVVEVYVPLTLPSGQRVAFEAYTTDGRVEAAKTQLTRTLVPFALLSLLVLVLAQLPVSLGLIRRTARAAEDRRRLLHSALTASDRERRTIARDLHDGVVQNLAGAGYAIGAVQAALPVEFPADGRRTLEKLSVVVRGAVSDLRTLMVDIYPPDLTVASLRLVLEDLAGRLRRAGVDAEVTVETDKEPSAEVAAAVYRAARECVSNIIKHADASHAWITVTTVADRIELRIGDDGRGLPAPVEGAEAGHLGLRLLHDGVHELGGDIRIGRPVSGTGTEVIVELPMEG